MLSPRKCNRLITVARPFWYSAWAQPMIRNLSKQDAHTGIYAWCLMWPHWFPLCASQIYKTILANGKVWVTKIALCCFPCVTPVIFVPKIPFLRDILSLCYLKSYRKWLSHNVMLISDLFFAHFGSKTVKQSTIPLPGTLQFPPFWISSASEKLFFLFRFFQNFFDFFKMVNFPFSTWVHNMLTRWPPQIYSSFNE